MERPRCARGEGKYPWIVKAVEAGSEVFMGLHRRELGVVQACPAHPGVIECETQRSDEVQARAGVRTQADDVSGVARYLGLIEDDVEFRHPDIIADGGVVPALAQGAASTGQRQTRDCGWADLLIAIVSAARSVCK